MKLELGRADIGFGHVVLDDHGVTRKGVIGSDSIAYDDIRDYRLTIELGLEGGLGAGDAGMYLGDLAVMIDLAAAFLEAIRSDGSPDAPPRKVRLGIELLGASSRVDFNWRFEHVDVAIAHVLERIDERITTACREQLRDTGVFHAGPLALSADAIRWGTHDAIAKADVESIELFDSSPVELRVMKRGKVLPYGHARTSEIPWLGSVLVLADELGYPVSGRGLIRAFRGTPTACELIASTPEAETRARPR